MSETDPLQEYFEQRQAEHAARVKAQEELVASPTYQSELKFIERMTGDIIMLLSFCLMYSGRAGEYSENSLTIRSTDDLAQSVLAAWHLIQRYFAPQQATGSLKCRGGRNEAQAMTVQQPRYSKEKFARRGDEIYESQVRPQVEAGNEGKIAAIC